MVVVTGVCADPTLKEFSAEIAKEDTTTFPFVKVSIHFTKTQNNFLFNVNPGIW